MRILYQTSRLSPITNAVASAAKMPRGSGRLGDAPLPVRHDRFAAGKRGGAFRRRAISRESPVHQRQVGGLEPTVAREHVCGPDVISTATVNGAREGARVEIMSVGCPQTAGRASRSGQVPDYLSRNIPSAYARKQGSQCNAKRHAATGAAALTSSPEPRGTRPSGRSRACLRRSGSRGC
jgi:hypothetical protein